MQSIQSKTYSTLQAQILQEAFISSILSRSMLGQKNDNNADAFINGDAVLFLSPVFQYSIICFSLNQLEFTLLS